MLACTENLVSLDERLISKAPKPRVIFFSPKICLKPKICIQVYCEQKRYIDTEKSKQGIGKIAQWLKHRSGKDEDLDSDLHNSYKCCVGGVAFA